MLVSKILDSVQKTDKIILTYYAVIYKSY